MKHNLITAVRMSRNDSVILSGRAYKAVTWSDLEGYTRQIGNNVRFIGTEARLSDSGEAELFRTFELSKIGDYQTILLAVVS